MNGTPHGQTLLAGDVGGTHARLALFEGSDRAPVSAEVYESRDHAGLAEIVEAFLTAHPARPAVACFAVAGPVRETLVRRRSTSPGSPMPSSSASASGSPECS